MAVCREPPVNVRIPLSLPVLRRLTVVAGTAFLLAACASSRLHNEGLREVEAGQYESGIRKLEQAVKAEPANTTYRLELQGRKEEATQLLVAQADRLRAAANYADAEATYKRVLSISPGNDRAQRGIELVARDQRHAEAVDQAKRELQQGRVEEAETRLGRVLSENPGNSDANALRARIDTDRGPRTVTPRLKTRDNRPVSLQFREANTKMVFEVLARQTGINFIFDREVKNDGRTTIFVQNVPVESAIDLVLGQNQLARQVLAENMVLIYPNSAVKQREYQDQLVRTFYLTNTDPKKASEMLKTVLNAKTLFVDERASAVVMRDTPEVLRMAERLIASVDVPEAEVMMEVEVLEITRSRLQQLGLRYPEQVSISPTALGADATSMVLGDFKGQNENTLKVSNTSLTLDMKRTLTSGNILASPRIRARNHEKAKILIGQRVPVITNTVTPTTSQPVVTGSVQYVDVGLSLDVEPTVYMDNDVAIKVNLEVSTIIKEVTAGQSGTLAYQIGTRNASTLLRLKDGETQILAGLINSAERTTADRIPGLGDMPIIGRLFGSKKNDGEKTEIVLSITPRIIRAQPRASSENAEFWYGTESSVRSAPIASSSYAAPVSAAGAVVTTTPVAPPAESAAPSTEAAATTEAAPEMSAEAAAVVRPTLSWEAPTNVRMGESFDVSLLLSSKDAVANIRSAVRFDPAVLELSSADAGTMVPEAARASLRPVINQRAGRAQFDVPSTGIQGDGTLVTLHFRALSARPTTMIAVQQFALAGADGIPMPVAAPRPITLVVSQ
jgi:general secretion pathway protein D